MSLRGEKVFRGHFRHTVDPKGRLSIPAKFREALADGYGEKLVIVPNGAALEVHPLKSWQELEAKVSALPRFDQDARQVYLDSEHVFPEGNEMLAQAMALRIRPPAPTGH